VNRNGRTALYGFPINLTEQDGKTIEKLEGELMGVEKAFNSRRRLSQTSQSCYGNTKYGYKNWANRIIRIVIFCECKFVSTFRLSYACCNAKPDRANRQT
jgi:hypothetical protein